MRAGGDRWGVGVSRAPKALKSTTLNQELYSSKSNHKRPPNPILKLVNIEVDDLRGNSLIRPSLWLCTPK